MYPLVCLCFGLICAWGLQKLLPVHNTAHIRHPKLHGLLGLLSLVVFLCHALTWQIYLAEGEWKLSTSVFYTVVTQSTMVLFLMTASFLLTHKILQNPDQRIDWIGLGCWQIVRMLPMYWVAMLVLFGITALVGLKNPTTPLDTPLQNYGSWLAFSIPGTPKLHGVEATNVVMAMSTWRFVFEWIFFLSLPFIAFLGGKKPPIIVLVLAGLGLFWITRQMPFYGIFYGVLAVGAGAAWIAHHGFLKKWACQPWIPLVMVLLLGLNIYWNTTAYTAASVVLLGLIFILLVCGNALTALLEHRVCHVLGLGSYSMYLLHGPLLYMVMKVAARYFPLFYATQWHYWGMVALAVPVLVVLGLAAYFFIEAPLLRRANALATCTTSWLKIKS